MSGLPKAVEEKIADLADIQNDTGRWTTDDEAIAARFGAREMAEWLMAKVCEECGIYHNPSAWSVHHTRCPNSEGKESRLITRAEFLARQEGL